MCRILFKKDNTVKFDFNVLADSYKGNPDGTGVMYFNGETMVIQKFEPTESIETIYAYVQSIENIAEAKNIAIHFRISTSGRGTDMTHPHHVNGNMWIMHNGIMTYGEWKEFQEQWYNRNSNISDTRFTAMWINEMGFAIDEMNCNGYVKKLLSSKFSGSKVLVVENEKFTIINEDLGEWVGNIWRSWKEWKGTTYPANNYYRRNSFFDDVVTEEVKAGKHCCDGIEFKLTNAAKNMWRITWFNFFSRKDSTAYILKSRVKTLQDVVEKINEEEEVNDSNW